VVADDFNDDFNDDFGDDFNDNFRQDDVGNHDDKKTPRWRPSSNIQPIASNPLEMQDLQKDEKDQKLVMNERAVTRRSIG